jgi:hypothetical protein
MCSSDGILRADARWTTIDDLGCTVADDNKDQGSPTVDSCFDAKHRRIVIGPMLVARVVVG